MSNQPRLPRLALVVVALLSCGLQLGCRSATPGGSPSPVAPPPAPAMPAGWSLRSDWVVPDDQRQAISDKLGAPILGLRNTVYDAAGERVQLNVLLAADVAGAQALVATLRGMKSDEALVRRGRVVYELVAGNSAQAQVAEAHTLLETTAPVP